MEPPPRLFQYNGLFTTHRSIDLPLKVVSIVLTFVVLLFCAAWHISKKSYRRAPKDLRLFFRKMPDLSDPDLCEMLTSSQLEHHTDAVTAKFGTHNVLLVSDWKLINLYELAANLDLYFSLVPRSLRRKWYGLLVSDYTLAHRSELRSLLLHTFDRLPNSAYSLAGTFAADQTTGGKSLLTSPRLDGTALDLWIWGLIMEFALFNSPDRNSMRDLSDVSRSRKSKFVWRLYADVLFLERIHLSGWPKPINGKTNACTSHHLPSTISEFLQEFDFLLGPLVHYAFEKSALSCHSESVSEIEPTPLLPTSNTGWSSVNFLDQLMKTRKILEDQGDYVSFLSVTHVTHNLSEICMILRFILFRMLRVILTVLATKPHWTARLKSEATQALSEGLHTEHPNGFKKNSTRLPPACLHLQHTKCLVWSKALVCEAIRFCAPGWPFACLHEAVRDGKLNDYDYCEEDLVIFNHPAYFSEPDLWHNDPQQENDAEKKADRKFSLPFDPTRFLSPYSEEDGSQSGQQILDLPVHWARFILVGYTVCIPNSCIYRLLTAVLVHLFGTGWDIKLDENEADSVDIDDLSSLLTSDMHGIIMQPSP